MLWDTKEGKLWGLTKQWQRTCKKIKNIQECLKSIKYMILGTLWAFVQWHVAMIARHSLQLVMILNLVVDFITLTKNHKAHLHQKFYFGVHFG